MYAVTEVGLYKIIRQSRKPEALKFEHWITNEILQSTGKITLSPPEKVNQPTQSACENLKAEAGKAKNVGKSTVTEKAGKAGKAEAEKAEKTKKGKEPQAQQPRQAPQASQPQSQLQQPQQNNNDENESEITDPHIPEGFLLINKALYYIDRRCGSIYLCSYLRVLSKTVNIDTNESGKLLEFRTMHGDIRRIFIKNKDLFAGLSQTILKELASAGLHINLEATTKKILVYLNNYNPDGDTSTTRINGWNINVFLTENITITKEYEESMLHEIKTNRPIENNMIILDTPYGSTHVNQKGYLSEWRENVGKICSGNSRLVLAVSTAFAAPLLYILGRPNFGIQLIGKSSTGKTTALYVAASVYGPHAYVKSWRTTDNGLETVALNHNDMLLILDELGEMSPQKIGAAIYMLINGTGKTRANTSGEAKQPKTWRVALLSAGEIDLNTHMASAGITTMAGQNIRMLAVPAVPEGQRGLIENTHEFKTAAALVKHLISSTQRYHGTPLLEYIRAIMRTKERIICDFEDSLKLTAKEMLPTNADGQDNRVFDFFFTIGFAGELATLHGITGWPVGEATATALTAFEDWIARKGGYGNQEEKMRLYALRCFFQKHQHSRFLPLNQHNDVPEKIANEAMGYRKDTDNGAVFYVYPERFRDAIKREIVADIKDVLRLVAELGMLNRDSNDDHLTKVVWIGKKSRRMLVFNDKVLSDEG
jgi:putative DNA primase/helicase